MFENVHSLYAWASLVVKVSSKVEPEKINSLLCTCGNIKVSLTLSSQISQIIMFKWYIGWEFLF